ncbi:helix-turn-helix transcriptional regulator [Sabulicella rubraurantiaca]|uniref:helix-turn-helix transcriptional regulator n=1 Tax=Sabulicella rubraurantiaca TaxID=2811429 RepID=UPI001A964EB4|nr:helix-turn-helix transcriptional regulator [Sabulicella rubraurantiaca]
MAQAQPRPASPPPVGALLREWRQRRRRSQLDLSLDAAVSQRHLSCVESGRAAPSREMVLRLAAELDVPLRERNALLLAAGFAPAFRERGLDDPEMVAARTAVETLLHAHMPHPALAVDGGWNLVSANAAVAKLLGGLVDPTRLAPPVNVLRLSLHPEGLALRIRNLPEWRTHLLERLRREVATSADAGLTALLAELSALPAPGGEAAAPHGILVPLVLDTPWGTLSLISTTTVFGTPAEVTLSELAIETFFPANAETAERLCALG